MILPPPEQSVLHMNYDYWPQCPRPQLQQHQYHAALLPIARPLPQPCVQSGYDPCQSTAGYHKPYVPYAVASPQPQLPYYPQLQPQQQQQRKRLHHASLQHLMPTKRQQLDNPDLNRHLRHHAPLPRFQLPLSLAQSACVYPCQNQGSGHGDESGGPNNAQFSVNEDGATGNYGGMSCGSACARGGLMLGTRGGMPHAGSNGGNDPFVHAHDPGGNFGGAASMQAETRNQFPNIAESATAHVATQFGGAQGFTISGHPIMTNIGMNNGVHNVTTVNHYGGIHGLEKLEIYVSFAALHNSAAQDPERRCHPGTRESVLSRLRLWINNPNSTDCIFWLHGPVGAGKSAIAQTVAHEYHQGEVAATFFFFRSDAMRSDGNRLFTTIVWQLAFSIPATKDFIIQALDKAPHLPTADVETQFEQLIVYIFRRMNNVNSRMWHPAPVVIIDGVDECLDEQLQRRILAVIGNAVKNSHVPLRFLISSRPEALIEETLNHFQEFTLRVDLATLDDSNPDIKKYLVDKFSAIASKQGLDPAWPSQEIIEEIVFKSSGNFILASTLIRFIGDEDYSAESQLDIVRKLKPRGTVSPFALLDELYLEILKQPRDQDFLKTFLALFVSLSSIIKVNPCKDNTTLMNVSEKELHIKLRRMRALLKFEPFIDVYHKSFLDFLQDSSRSGQYHVTKQGGLKRYLELIVDSVIRHISMAIEQPNCHEACHLNPHFTLILNTYPTKIVLPIKDWQEALKPLLHLQDKLLNTPKLRPCCVTQVMRDLQLHLMILHGDHIAAAQVPHSNMNKSATGQSLTLVTEAGQATSEKDLDRCLSGLLSCLLKTDSVLSVDMVIIGHMVSLLAFNPAETAARVRSVINAQKLIDLIDLLISHKSLLNRCGPDAARKTALLASEIFARVPLLPRSVFLNERTHRQHDWLGESGSGMLERLCQSMFISRILDHDYILPALWIYRGDKRKYVDGNINERNESLHKWLKRSRPNFVTRMRVILEVARTIRYIHSMDDVAALGSFMIESNRFVLDSNLCAKIMFRGAFAWQIRENLIMAGSDFTHESNISAFADLFQKVSFDGDNENLPSRLVEDAMQLIERCRVKDPKSRPTMEDVVKEMETWNLT